MNNIRVRFAPSPTGPLHIGGVRTALYNYLFARKYGGSLILRIEDTDQARFVPGAEEYIIEALAWLGIRFDEGVHIGGAHAPYRQSDRKPLYRQHVDRLIADGWAYCAFDTPEALDARRREYERQGKTFQYDAATRGAMCNSLTLPEEEVRKRLNDGAPYVVRFKFPADTQITVNDLIRGTVTVNSGQSDDKVLFKSDGMPTYHLANVADDHAMQISHVIRGEEWLPSAPLHVMLYRALGWEDSMPQFAHLPLLLKPDGNGKLSKRDGDRLGFPVFPLQWRDPASGEVSSGYRESGYLPQAVINMLALLGWNPGTQQEKFTMQELIDLFSLERISKAGAKFDLKKAHWFNHEYLMEQPVETIAGWFSETLKGKNLSADPARVARVCRLVKERVNFVSEIWDQASFFFVAPESYDPAAMKKRWKENTPAVMRDVRQLLESLPVFSGQAVHDALQAYAEERSLGMGEVMIPLRIALTGGTFGPDLQEIADVLGREEVLRRTDGILKNRE
ncbi:MAG: glutamate--tRNA ligase [Bacteroidales bacterium]|jgi:glutamyl-tRNA synthetase|nr:glutamate--tRNA ligase [Bacteroidales bacterium]